MSTEGQVNMHRQYILGGATVLGMLAVLSQITVGVRRYLTSIQGAGTGLLRMDVALLLAYGVAGIWFWYERRPAVTGSLRVGTWAGVLLGIVHTANHAIESFVPIRNFVFVIAPVFLMVALFGAAGSAAWERTRSITQALIAGLCCAIVSTLIALCAAFYLNLAFEARAELRLYHAFVASGMYDPGAFLVRNMLEAASEALIRMPAFALLLSLIGAAENAWISRRSQAAALATALAATLMFVTGAVALWYADSLDRTARPPFIMAGILLAGISACGAHPIWSAVRRNRTGIYRSDRYQSPTIAGG